MGISQYIKEIGRGPRGARPLTRAQAADLFGQVLDGAVTDLETGAFCLAMRIKGETAEEMCGFLDATHQRLALLPTTDRPLIVLPSYNGARKLPVLTPLLALLLARKGLPVLLHGMRAGRRWRRQRSQSGGACPPGHRAARSRCGCRDPWRIRARRPFSHGGASQRRNCS